MSDGLILEGIPTRCEITNNPCGSDTWEIHTPCKCRKCQAWIMEHITELVAAYKHTVEDNEDLVAKLDAMKETLQEIADQKTTDELSVEGDYEGGDFEGGYEAIVLLARAAIGEQEQGE